MDRYFFKVSNIPFITVSDVIHINTAFLWKIPPGPTDNP